MINAVVLAAGESRRMGKPKPLLRFTGGTFLGQIIAVLKLSDVDRITVVLGAEAEAIRKTVDLSGTEVVINKNYQKGQLSSLIAAIETTPPKTQAILVCLADMPFITAEVVNEIVAKFKETSAAIIVPVFDGKRGHPTLFARAAFDELLNAPPEQGARFVLYSLRPGSGQANEGRILELQTSQSGILVRIDTPNDYRLHFGVSPGQWPGYPRQKAGANFLTSVFDRGRGDWARKIIPVILISLAVKCLLARYFLFNGDEAYFTLWGKHISAGYYDHPPMIGWLLHLLLYVGDSVLLLRLLPIVFSTAVGVGLYMLLKPYDERKAYLVFVLFMVCPMNTMFILVAPDDPLLLFSFLSVFFLFRAERATDFTDYTDLVFSSVNPCKSVSKNVEIRRSYLYYFLSGVFWGLAFLSKYFAVLLVFSYLVYFLSVCKKIENSKLKTQNSKLFLPLCLARSRIKGILLFVLGATPFVAQNALWNYQNGWPNIMHNWFNRFGSNPNPAVNLLCLGLSLLYLMTPPVVYFLVKNRSRILQAFRQEDFRVLALSALVPLCVFVLVSLKKSVGPHWYWSFLPCAFVVAGLTLDANQIVKSIKFSCVFSLIQACLFLAVPLAPLESLKGLVSERDRASLIFYIHPEKVERLLEQYRGDFVFATRSYSSSALLEYHCGDRVIVFGNGSRHARQDDIRTDFRELDATCGQGLPPGTGPGAKPDDTGSFFLVLGYDFKYQGYRQKYLRSIMSRFYQIPAWLPHANNFFFREKYGFWPSCAEVP